MGNDLEVVSKDDLEQDFYKYSGLPDETVYDFINRTFYGFINDIISPTRMIYTKADLMKYPNCLYNQSYTQSVFTHQSNTVTGQRIAGSYWCYKDTNDILLIYIHTNRRSCVDALEILPLCKELQASLVSFDLPGSGLTDVCMNSNSYLEIDTVLDWLTVNNHIGCDTKVFIWGRGMGIQLALQYCYTVTDKSTVPITGIILDTPYISIQRLIEDYLDKVRKERHNILPSFVYKMAVKYIRYEIEKRTGINTYTIPKPVDMISSIMLPVMIMTAIDDDYIPANHSKELIDKCDNASSRMIMFEGGHYSRRSEELVLKAKEFISREASNCETTNTASCQAAHCVTVSDGRIDQIPKVLARQGAESPVISMGEGSIDVDIDIDVGDDGSEPSIAAASSIIDSSDNHLLLHVISRSSSYSSFHR